MVSTIGLLVSRLSTGVYEYEFLDPYTDATYSVIGQVIDTVTDTNVMVSSITSTGFVLMMGEGDNNTDADVLVDVEHSVTVFGVDGPSGTVSAYETWLDVGNTGTQQDFLDTIDGATGADGATGVDGATGPDGATGLTGATGEGATGATGAEGATGIPGTGITLKGTVPTVNDLPTTNNNVGDLYIVGATGDGYAWDGSVWSNVGPIAGPIGPSGATGATGIEGPQGATGIDGATGPAGGGFFIIDAERNDTTRAGDAYSFGNGAQNITTGVIISEDCIFRSISVTSVANINAGATVTLLINDVASSGSVVAPGGTTEATSTQLNIAISAGDKVTFSVTSGQIEASVVSATFVTAGAIGDIGATGPIGDPGGATGATGIEGPIGATGADSFIPGPEGATGPVGATGEGSTGATGEQGATGDQGIPGTGIQLQGSLPYIGPPQFNGGASGDLYIDSNGDGWAWDGLTWTNVGPIAGPVGSTGATGVDGASGADGATGATGADGADGFGIYATARTEADGTLVSATGLSVSRIATGIYDYTFTDPYVDASYGVVGQVFDTVTDTNVMVSDVTSTGFRIILGEGDNNTDADVLVDVEHVVTVFGVSGPSGSVSAYQTWLDVGNVGTEQDFLDSIQGDTGATGADGVGVDGATGATGADGVQGATGADGVGVDGATGATGIEGPQGATGADGATGAGVDGATGATGSEGPAGATGADGATGANGGTDIVLDTTPQLGGNLDGLNQNITNINELTVASAMFGGAQPLRAFNIYGSGFNGRISLQGPAASNPGVEFTTNANATRALFRYQEVGSGSELQLWNQPNGGAISKHFVFGDTGRLFINPQGSGIAQPNDAGFRNLAGVMQFKDSAGAWTDIASSSAAGATGATGVTGADGATGATGADGVQGSTGATGADGIQGATGADGIQGATGADGVEGPAGATGADGVEGPQGATGAGATGATGADGIQGATGADGIQGATGAGATGATGAHGAREPQVLLVPKVPKVLQVFLVHSVPKVLLVLQVLTVPKVHRVLLELTP